MKIRMNLITVMDDFQFFDTKHQEFWADFNHKFLVEKIINYKYE